MLVEERSPSLFSGFTMTCTLEQGVCVCVCVCVWWVGVCCGWCVHMQAQVEGRGGERVKRSHCARWPDELFQKGDVHKPSTPCTTSSSSSSSSSSSASSRSVIHSSAAAPQ